MHRLVLVVVWLPLSTPQALAADPPDPHRGAVISWYDVCQRKAAREAGIDWLLAKAVRVKESFHDASYISTTGAVGLMQLMPTGGGRMYVTASYRAFIAARRAPDRRHKGKRDREWAEAYRRELFALLRRTPQQKLRRLDRRFDPCWNMRRGTYHLAADLRRFRARYPSASKRDLRRMALAAYFAGPGRVRFRGGKPVFLGPRRAIERYVDDLLGVYGRLRKGLPGR
jgi:soluble lytic murein transglycosylase-like protein